MLGLGGVAYVPIHAPCDEEGGGERGDWKREIIGRIPVPFAYGTFFNDKQVNYIF